MSTPLMNIADPANPVSKLGFCNAVYVFGSNLAGLNTRGPAGDAVKYLGADPNVVNGVSGEGYAIPTKDKQLRNLPLDVIKDHVKEFLKLAASKPNLRFQLTRIGCGMSAYKDEEIAPLFKGYSFNVILPGAWNAYMSRPSVRVLLDAQPGVSVKQVLAPMTTIADRIVGEEARRSLILMPTNASIPLGSMTKVWRLLSLPDPIARFKNMPPEDKRRITNSTLIWFCSDLVSVSADRAWRSPLEQEAREAKLNVVMA